MRIPLPPRPIAIAVTACLAGPAAGSEEEVPFALDLGGRVMWDTDAFDGALNRDHDGDWRFDGYLRRARVEIAANLPQDFFGILDINVNDDGGVGDAEIHAAGLGYTGWEFADIFVGRTKEPFGLEELTSSKAISTIERNYFTEATDVDSQPHFGARLDGMAGRVGWSAGVFNPAGNPQTEDGGDRLAFTGRLFGAPILEPDRVLHLGAAYTDRNLDQDVSATGFRLDVAEGGGELDSSSISIDEDRQVGLEALYIQGPFSVQGEAFRRNLSGAAGGPDGQVDHQYVLATWTITGESRPYKPEAGIPDIIRPETGGGAMELVARIDRIRFDVDGQADEKARGLLLGANWYPNRYVKLAVNVIRLDSDEVVADGEPDDATVISTRVQFAF